MDATTTKDSHTYKVPSTVHLASCSHRLLVSFGIVPPQVEGSKKGETRKSQQRKENKAVSKPFSLSPASNPTLAHLSYIL